MDKSAIGSVSTWRSMGMHVKMDTGTHLLNLVHGKPFKGVLNHWNVHKRKEAFRSLHGDRPESLLLSCGFTM